MEYIKGKKQNDVTGILTNYIKKAVKEMTSASMVADIEFSNWTNGKGEPSFCRLRVGNEGYEFVGNIYEEHFVLSVKQALSAAKAIGIVKTYKAIKRSSAWRTEYMDVFDSLILMAKPCKEFDSLNKVLYKYTGKVLKSDEVFRVSVCGKRSTYDDSGNYKYLCHDSKLCKRLTDSIKENRKSKNDILTFSVKDWVSHGDDGDYDSAMYHESEWYGSRGKSLNINVTTKGGKNKLDVHCYSC